MDRRVVSKDQAERTVSDRLRGQVFVHCGGGRIEGVSFEDEAARALVGKTQLRTAYHIRAEDGQSVTCIVSFGEELELVKAWCAESEGISRDEIELWFEGQRSD